jgi:hypothetical protein
MLPSIIIVKSKRIVLFVCILIFGSMLLILGGCSSNSSNNSDNEKVKDAAEDPLFADAIFSNPTQIDNEYLPLTPGTVHLYKGESEDGSETTVVEVLETTKEVNGVTSVIVQDRVFLDDLMIEDTFDWFAQDDDGIVWYMGEDVTNYEYDDDDILLGTDNDGGWEAGVDGALPGIVMKADLIVNDSYQQEYYEGVAEDMARIIALDVQVYLKDGNVYANCLKTLDWNPFEPDDKENKYYAPDVGMIREELKEDPKEESAELIGIFLVGSDQVPDFGAAVFSNPTTIDNTYLPMIVGRVLTYEADTEDGIETITTEVLDETQVVNGVLCRVFNDKVTLDGLLMEDTNDWFAQDDDGNVWYMGEEVTNYEYDDDDNLLGTNDDGSWEAGVDGALPGIVMWADPQAGVSYYQEYWEDEAEDMGFVVALGVDVELADGTDYPNCLQVLDWNPLDPAGPEYKYYAPVVGLVKEEVVSGEESAELN